MTPIEITKDMIEKQIVSLELENYDLMEDYNRESREIRASMAALHLKNGMFIKFLNGLKVTLM